MMPITSSPRRSSSARARMRISTRSAMTRTGPSSLPIRASASGPMIIPMSSVLSSGNTARRTRRPRPNRPIRRNPSPRRCRNRSRNREHAMPSERFDFPNARGEKLSALLDRPAGTPIAFALFAHCFTCGKNNLAAKRIAEGLTERGIAVLRFDFTGLGASEGEFANTNFSSNVADLVAAANHMRVMFRAPAILIGHSLGGAAVLCAAAKLPEARAVVTIGAPADPAHVVGLFEQHVPDIQAQGEVEVKLAGRPFRIR